MPAVAGPAVRTAETTVTGTAMRTTANTAGKGPRPAAGPVF
jgi:hypothetical protein